MDGSAIYVMYEQLLCEVDDDHHIQTINQLHHVGIAFTQGR